VDTPRSVAGLLVATATGDQAAVRAILSELPSLATAPLSRQDEFFIAESSAQVYEGDTALHAAAFAFDVEIARYLLKCGANVRARNRRGAEPLHSAVMGGPANSTWDPVQQRSMIVYLVDAGADPTATALGGVTPLHRAARNRCSAAVDALLRAGADPAARNSSGSTPLDLARWTTGRGGTGSDRAKAEQRRIIELLEPVTGKGSVAAR
jgi:ankyrin repeat protein